MASTFSMRSLLSALPATTRAAMRPPTPLLLQRARPTPSSQQNPPPTTTLAPSSAPFSTTAALAGRIGKKAKAPKPQNKKKLEGIAAAKMAEKRRKSMAAQAIDPKVIAMWHFLYAPTSTQPPLRMARNRRMRHWTVHRAWQLLQRQREERRERELMQMQQSMANACEALRNMGGPGTRPTGWLYRKSMEKVGVWGIQAVPIEYARPMVETPGATPWNHEWKRE